MKANSRAIFLGLVVAAACGGEAASTAPAAAPPPASAPPAAMAQSTSAAPAVPSADVASSTPAAADPTPAATAATTPPAAGKADIQGTVSTIPAKTIQGGGVVYLEDAPKEPGKGMSTTIDNIRMAFVPYISVITAGGKVRFSNQDPFPHNVFSPGPPAWNVGNLSPHSVKEKTFDQPAIYSLLCNLHPNMLAYLVVSPSSYFAKTDSKGKYVIHDVPAGTYKITGWAPRLKPTTQSVTVAGTPVTVDITVRR